MSIEESANELKTVPCNSLIVVDKKCDNTTVRVRRFREGIIALTGFAIAQFLEGAELLAQSKHGCSRKDTLLILRLAKGIGVLQHNPSVSISVDYLDLVHLREWLELRMAHCEVERDQRTVIHVADKEFPKFNADTYIGQKLLLLDLRELMLGEIIEQQ